MSDRVTLHNTNQHVSREIFSADGDSVHILPGSKQPVDKKFLWNLPSDVSEFKDYQTVFSRKKGSDEVSVKQRDVTAKSGNLKNAEDDRPTVAAGVIPEAPVSPVNAKK